MDQHIGDPRVSLLDRVFYVMRNSMPVADGDSPIHSDVQIDIKRKTHLANQTFLNLQNSRNRKCGPPDHSYDLAARRCIQDLMQGREKEAHAIGTNDDAGEKRCPRICALPSFATD